MNGYELVKLRVRGTLRNPLHLVGIGKGQKFTSPGEKFIFREISTIFVQKIVRLPLPPDCPSISPQLVGIEKGQNESPVKRIFVFVQCVQFCEIKLCILRTLKKQEKAPQETNHAERNVSDLTARMFGLFLTDT